MAGVPRSEQQHLLRQRWCEDSAWGRQSSEVGRSTLPGGCPASTPAPWCYLNTALPIPALFSPLLRTSPLPWAAPSGHCSSLRGSWLDGASAASALFLLAQPQRLGSLSVAPPAFIPSQTPSGPAHPYKPRARGCSVHPMDTAPKRLRAGPDAASPPRSCAQSQASPMKHKGWQWHVLQL